MQFQENLFFFLDSFCFSVQNFIFNIYLLITPQFFLQVFISRNENMCP